MFSQLEAPPLERGITWSTVRLEREPQYWQVQPSRAKTARRVMRRLWVSCGTRTYVTRRMTIGRGIVVVSAWRSHVARSSSSAFSLSSRTTARRTEHTLMGSNVAFRTSTRPPPSRPRRWCSESGVDDTGPGGLDCMAVSERIAGGRGHYAAAG